MSQSTVSSFESDLRMPVEPILIVIFLLGAAAAVIGGTPTQVGKIRPLVAGLWMLPAIAWLIIRNKPRAGAWFLSISLAIVVQAIALGAPLPGAITLLVIPIAVAAALLDSRSAALFALSESALLGLMWHLQDADSSAIAIAFLSIWAIFGITWAIDARVRRVAQWTSAYYEHARTMLGQVYDQRTEREQTVADLAHANRQLALMNEKLLAARLLAEEAQRAKAAFVANVSHEFRTPLNMIIGLVDLLLEIPDIYGRSLPPALLEDLEIVHRNCEHLSSMITDVLDLSQVEAGRLALRREQVNLVEVIERAIGLTRPLIDKKGLSLDVTVPSDLPEVYCDRTRIRQVIVNLMSNAA
ncbi:MAG: histidine kinase dimerization/phospho-acceptor domain-containing protein, partial [Chloroflexota bacterium]